MDMTRSTCGSRFLAPLLLVGAVGCAASGAPDAAGVDGWQAPNQLEPVGAAPLVLEPYAEREVAFRYVRSDGSPVEGAVIDFSLQGEAGASSLAATAATSGPDGMATVVLRAGAPARFEVEAAGPRGELASLPIEVRPLAFADLAFRVGYRGRRIVTRVEAALFGNIRCADLAVRVPAPAATREPALGATERFENVQVGVTQALVALGVDARGHVAAEACVEATLDGTAEHFVEVTLQDLPEELGGTYETVERFDVTAGFDPRMDALLNAMRGLSEDPAAYLVDYVAGRDGTPRWLRDALSFPPTRALVVAKLRETLDRIHLPEELSRLLSVGAELERAFSSMTLRGQLRFEAAGEFDAANGTHSVSAVEVSTSRGTATMPVSAEAPVRVRLEEGIEIEEHALPIAFGDLVRLVLREAVLSDLPGAPSSVAEYVGSLFDCEAIASELAGDGSDAAPLVEAACDLGAASLGASIEGWILRLGEYETLHLQGRAALLDTDGDYDRDRIERGVAQARWEGLDGEIHFEGTFEGARQGDTSGRPHRLRDAMNRLH